MSTYQAVATRALDNAQTAALLGMDHEMLVILVTALKFIASGGKVYTARWDGLKKERE
jgi:hypothetical protein